MNSKFEMSYDALLGKASPIPAKYRREGKYTPVDDPSEYYIAAPEKGAVKVSGYAIDRDMEVRMRELLDKEQYHFRTMADISRSALYHFMYSVVMQGEGHTEHYKAIARSKKREAKLMNIGQDQEMLTRAQRHYRRATEMERDDIVIDIMSDLRQYIAGLGDEDRQESMRTAIVNSEMGARYEKHLAGIAAERAEEKRREEEEYAQPGLEPDEDEALDALVKENK